MNRPCTNCGSKVESERIELLDSYVCAACAQSGIAQPPVEKGIMVYDHKTGGQLHIVSEAGYELHKESFGRVGQQSILRKITKDVD
jgi:hypothetical protein